MKKKKYDTAVILLYLTGKEHLLPKAFRKTIPYSTISTWRQFDYTTYEGHQFRFLFEQNWESVRIQNEHPLFKKQLRGLIKTLLLFKREWQAFVKEARGNPNTKKHIQQSIQYLEPSLGLVPTLKIFTVSQRQYLA